MKLELTFSHIEKNTYFCTVRTIQEKWGVENAITFSRGADCTVRERHLVFYRRDSQLEGYVRGVIDTLAGDFNAAWDEFHRIANNLKEIKGNEKKLKITYETDGKAYRELISQD